MKGKFRKSIAILLAMILTFTIIGCSQSKSSSSASNGGASQASAGGEAKSKSKYPEKDIEFIVGFGSGGYNDWARALQPYLEKYLPKKVNVVVRNMEGAGSVISANYMYKAKPDGYTIGIWNMTGLAASQVSREVSYDLSKVSWIGRVAEDAPIALVSSKNSYKTIEDFKKQEKPQYIMSTKGLGGDSAIIGAVTLAKLGVKWSPLNHNGTGESNLAIVRGDADITWGSFESQQQYLDNGDMKMVLYYGNKRHPKYPDVPIPSEVGLPDLNVAFNSQRLIGGPPGMPEDVRAILEEALKKAVEDPEFKELIQKQKKSINYMDAKETETVVKEALKSYVNYKDIIADLLNKAK